MKRSGRAGSSERDTATAQSGTDRTAETKTYPLLASLPGRAAMHVAFRLQELFLTTELGNGYIVVAEKK
jgi:hypothetical protein